MNLWENMTTKNGPTEQIHLHHIQNKNHIHRIRKEEINQHNPSYPKVYNKKSQT